MSLAPADFFPAAPSFRPREDAFTGRRRVPDLLADASRRGAGMSKSAPRAPAVEIAFLANYGVPAEVLNYAMGRARADGVSADAVLLAENIVNDEFFYRALADHLSVAFLVDEIDLARGAALTAEQGYVPLIENAEGLRWLFAPTGAGIFRLMSVVRAAGGRPLFALTTPGRLTDALRRARPVESAQAASLSAERVDRALCVRRALGLASLAVATTIVFGVVAGLYAPWEGVRLSAAFLLACASLSSVFLRLYACVVGLKITEEVDVIENARLPVYTVIVALYKEAAVARQLARAIDRLDYPRAKLDVKFVVECDDEATAKALRAHPPRTPHEIIVAPEGAPRTKPRALNIAMPFARGALVAVYDAEDLPDGRQLRRAASIFDQAPPEVACLQASLAIDNAGLNWMASLFALDYAALFDVYNKGLAALGLPLFLGGTSNHFRIEALREVGFWDAYNVTEDADLGLRLARAGYAVRTFDSHTLEEAPATFRALVKQRSRWLKGWMQTGIVHCRHPVRFFADFGARRALAVLAMFAGGLLGPMFGPFLTIRLVHDLLGVALGGGSGFGRACVALWCFVAVAGAAAVVAPLLLGARRRGLSRRALVFLPLWLLMLSVASWRAFFELWLRPFHWEKTEHGLTQRGEADAGDQCNFSG
ncbi:glycosyltransferase XagB [freshwater sediment metagenome]|uniref:Glycosyltransferase XagB n=1 Tax=freshwater sediment metagenome TaxID=556182 RepID=A0AA48M436_9ZZZZ